MATVPLAARRPPAPLVFLPRARRGPLVTPLMARFIVLSALLHVLGVLLFGAPAGGSPQGRAMWGSLSVVIRESFREADPQLRLDREVPRIEREALRKRAPTPAEKRPDPTPVPLATSPRFEAPPTPPAPEKPVPKAEPEPAETPYVVPPMLERLRDRPRQYDLEPAPTIPPPSEPAPVQRLEAPPAPPRVEAPPAPKAEPAPPPTPKIEPPKVEAPLPRVEAPPPAPVVETPKIEAPLPTLEPTPPPRAEPPPAPVQAPIAQPVVPEAVRIPPPAERPRVTTPAVPPVAPTPEIEAPAPAPPMPSAAPTPASASGVPPASPEPAARPEAPRAAPPAPPAPREESPFRRAAPPASRDDASRKPLDLDSIRGRAREIAREGTGNRAPLTFPMPPLPEKKNKIEQALEKARKPDCRDAYKDLGLLAVVPLVANEFGEGTCRW